MSLFGGVHADSRDPHLPLSAPGPRSRRKTHVREQRRTGVREDRPERQGTPAGKFAEAEVIVGSVRSAG